MIKSLFDYSFNTTLSPVMLVS